MKKAEETKKGFPEKQEQKDKKVYTKPSIESHEMFEAASGEK